MFWLMAITMHDDDDDNDYDDDDDDDDNDDDDDDDDVAQSLIGDWLITCQSTPVNVISGLYNTNLALEESSYVFGIPSLSPFPILS